MIDSNLYSRDRGTVGFYLGDERLQGKSFLEWGLTNIQSVDNPMTSSEDARYIWFTQYGTFGLNIKYYQMPISKMEPRQQKMDEIYRRQNEIRLEGGESRNL